MRPRRIMLYTFCACMACLVPAPERGSLALAAGVSAGGFTVSGPHSMTAGSTQQFWITITNSGADIWQGSGPESVRLDIGWAQRDGRFVVSGGRFVLPATLDPGKSVTVRVGITAPTSAGAYLLRYQVLRAGSGGALGRLDVPVSVAAVRCTGASTAMACAAWMLAIINRDRTRAGLQPYSLNAVESTGSGRCAGAYGHSVHMAHQGTVSHDQFPGDICASSIRRAGENVGVYGSGTVTIGLTMLEAMMLGEPHDAATCATQSNHACNILSKQFRQVGIGIYDAAGSVWLTEDFTG